MSAQQKQSSSSSSSKSTSGNSSENATGSGGAGSYSLATASPGTPPTPAPRPPKVKKPKKKKTAVGDASVMGAAPNTNDGPPADTAAPTTTGGGAGAAKGPASEAGKASKAITSKKPSQFLTAYKGMGKAVTTAKQQDEQTAHNAIPQFHAVMPSDAQVEQDNKEQNATADKKVDDKGEGPEAQAKTGRDKKAKKAKRQKVDGKAKSDLRKYEDMLEALQNIFGSVVGGINTDSQVNTSPGPAPEIEFSGQSNPVRADKAHKSADSKINEGHEKFAKAIDEGKQPSDVKRQEMDEVHDLIKNPDPTIGEESVAAGQKYFEQLMAQHQSQEIDAADPLFHDRVQTQMAEANKQMDSTLEKQETERQEAVANLEKDIDAKNKEAKDKQEEIVAKEKGKIAEAQKETRKKQDKEVKKAKRKGDKERRKVEKDIDKREKDDEKKIKTKYKEADKKAEGEKKRAHSKAAKKKQEAKKKQKKKSWWDRVKSAVSDFVDSVCSVIGDIFDALGKLVSGILNAVKKLAASVIDAAIKWAKKALDSLGGFMKGLVNGLIGDIFPGAAKWLNDKIDSGINLAKKGVEKVGDDLKKGVEAAVDGVNKTVQKGLQVAKTGMQTAVRVAGKVATGDFEGAFLETLYGALGIAGVSRGDADKMLGNARDTLKSVVDAPGAFVGNLAKAGKDGFMSFGKNFLKHFTGAVTTWLLGPVAAAGLKAPEKWDAQGIFTMVLGVMGVSKESLMGMAEERIGKKNMGALQKAFDYVTSFLEGGFSGLWKQISGDLSNLWTLVLGSVTDYIGKKVVQMGAEALASMLAGPLGALWQALKTAWNIYCTIRDKIDQIRETLNAVFKSINDIAKGNTAKAAGWVEQSLVKALGIAIDLLARILNIGDIPQQIKGFVEALQARVKKAIGGAMDWVLKKVKGLFKSGKDDKKQDAKPVKDESGVNNGRTVSQLQGATLATSMGAITIAFNKPSGNGHPPILNAKGGISGPLRGKGIPDLEKQAKSATKSAAQAKALESIKHAKGVAMGLENKGQRYLAGDKNKSEIKKSMDVLGAHMLEAANFVGGLNKTDKGKDNLPKPHKFKAKDGTHTIYARRQGAGVQMTMASKEGPITKQVKAWKDDLNKLRPDQKKLADGYIAKALALEKAADQLSEAAQKPGADPALKTKAEKKMAETAVPMAELNNLLLPTPEKWDGNMNAFDHKSYEAFLNRATSMNPPMSQTEAQKLWAAVMKALGWSSSAHAKGKPSAAAQNDLSSDFNKAKAAFKHIAKEMLKGRFEMLNEKPYALWSGGQIAKDYAGKVGHTVLETTQAGKLFDNLKILADWPAFKLLWDALSAEYASKTTIGTVHCYLRKIGDTFSGIEKPVIRKKARDAGDEKKLKFKHHALVAPNKHADDRINKKLGIAPIALAEIKEQGVYESESECKAVFDRHNNEVLKQNDPNGSKTGDGKLEDRSVDQLLSDFGGYIRLMHQEGRKIMPNIFRANRKVIAAQGRKWDSVKKELLKIGTIKTWSMKPMDEKHAFGGHLLKHQGKTSAKKAHDDLIGASHPKPYTPHANELSYAEAKAKKVNGGQKHFAAAKKKCTEFLFDFKKDPSPDLALAYKLEMEAAADKGHTEYDIKPGTMLYKQGNVSGTAPPASGSFDLTYQTKNGQSFTVKQTADAKDHFRTDFIEADNLTLKDDPKGPDGRAKKPNATGSLRVGEGHNRSHLIADEFKGARERKSGNLVTTSSIYNQKQIPLQTMRWAEVTIQKWIRKQGQKLSMDSKDIVFKMSAKVEWDKLADNTKRLEQVLKDVQRRNIKNQDIPAPVSQAEMDKNIKDYLARHHNTKLMRVSAITYAVELKNGAAPIKMKPFTIGPDAWLGVFKK